MLTPGNSRQRATAETRRQRLAEWKANAAGALSVAVTWLVIASALASLGRPRDAVGSAVLLMGLPSLYLFCEVLTSVAGLSAAYSPVSAWAARQLGGEREAWRLGVGLISLLGLVGFTLLLILWFGRQSAFMQSWYHAIDLFKGRHFG